MTKRTPIFARLAAIGALGLGFLIGSLPLERSTATNGRAALTWVNQAQAQFPLPPLADAGDDRTVAIGATVVLDGSDTTDPESALLSPLGSLPPFQAAAWQV